MPYGMITSLLLLMMSGGYYSGHGILPLLVGKILLVKANLLLGPPIALGAFVVGQGTGLLLGKLVGISYIINKWIKLKRLDSHGHKVKGQDGWRWPGIQYWWDNDGNNDLHHEKPYGGTGYDAYPYASTPYYNHEGYASQYYQGYGNPYQYYEGYGSPYNAYESYGAPSNPSVGYGTPQKPYESFVAPPISNVGYGTPHNPYLGYGAPHTPSVGYGTPHNPYLGYNAPHTPNVGYGSPHNPYEGYGAPQTPHVGYGTPHNPYEGYSAPYQTYESHGTPHPSNEGYGTPYKGTSMYYHSYKGSSSAPKSKYQYDEKAAPNYYTSSESDYASPYTTHSHEIKYASPPTQSAPLKIPAYVPTESDVSGYDSSYAETEASYRDQSNEGEIRPTYESDHSVDTRNAKHKESRPTDSTASAAEQYILENFFKATNERPGMSEEKKLDILADLLQEQFNEELLRDEYRDAKKFGAKIPTAPATTTVATTTTTETPIKKIKLRLKANSTLADKVKKMRSKPKKKSVSIMSPLMDVIGDTDAGDILPESMLSYLFDGRRYESEEDPEIQLHLPGRSKRSTEVKDLSDLEVDKVTTSFIQDIKNLFSIVSFLDINRCLEKMVCEIHVGGGKKEGLTEYEKNIITAFRIMDKIMPLESSAVDSTTKYRQAAKFGQKLYGYSHDLCGKLYAGCGFSTQQIIQLGNIAVPAPSVQDAGPQTSTSTYSSVPAFRNAEDMDASSGI